MHPRTALVFGGSGLVGTQLLQRLVADPSYALVHSFGRSALSFSDPKCKQHLVELNDVPSFEQDLVGDDLFCCLGTTIRKAGSQEAFRRVDFEYPTQIAAAAVRQGLKQILVVTALGADPKSRIFYSRIKGETEAAITALGIPCTQFFRPSLILGDRSERRTIEKLSLGLASLVSPLLAGPLAKFRPVTAFTIAAAMVAVAKQELFGVNTFESDRLRELGASSGNLVRHG